MKTAKRPPAPAPGVRLAIAYSYLRFSSPDQRKGDSIRRQTEARDAWLAARTNVALDTALRMTDKGRSAFRRKNWDTYALAEFVAKVEAGEIAEGSYLLVENLDRLSREEAGKAVELFLRIVNRGIVVVQLLPVVMEFRRPVDAMALMFAVVELSRGHSESAMKSVRSRAGLEKAVALAREGKPMPPRRRDGRVTKAITARLPAWVEERQGRLELIEERAVVVRRIIEMARAGYGRTSIVKKLNSEKVPPFGDRVPDEDGRTRKRDGERYGCGEWRTAYVGLILSDRRAIGEYQPRDTSGKPKGDPIPGYYPAVVTEAEWYAARTAVSRRRPKRRGEKDLFNRQGAIGKGVPNLFGGLLRNARDGSTYFLGGRSDKVTDGNGRTRNRVTKILLNKSSVEGGSQAYTFPYAIFERAILSELREIDPAEVLGGGEEPADSAVLRGELDWVRERKVALSAELLRGDVAAIADALRGLEAREVELAEKLDDAAARAAKPIGATWREAKSLIDLLATAPDPEDVRLRLRSALRRIVDSIWLVVVPRGRYRLVEVSVWFRREDGGEPTYDRSYTVFYRWGRGNGKVTTPGAWAVRSFAADWDPASNARIGYDLRDPDEVRHAIDTLSDPRAYPNAVIEKILADGSPV